MKQTRIAGVIAFAGLATATLVLCNSPASARELIYSSAIPAKHPLHTEGLEPYFERVTEATGESLTFKLYTGGTLASAKTTLNAISTGSVDMGLLADVYNPSDLPVSAVTSDLAVLGKDARVMTGAVNETLYVDCEACKEDYLEEDILPLASYSLTPYHFMCAEGHKITTAEDIVGKKIRGTGAMGQLVQALGGTPVNITSSEIYEALQRGQVDCVLGPTPWLESYSLWDLVTNVTADPVGTYHGTNFININTDSWEELTPEQQEAMTSNLAKAVRDMAKAYEDDAEKIKNIAMEKGIEWLEVGENFHPRIAEYRTHNVENVIETGKSRGVEDPQTPVDIMEENVSKWTDIVNEIGTGTWDESQWDKFQAKLESEVFAKVEYP